jgi:hypothetical protein
MTAAVNDAYESRVAYAKAAEGDSNDDEFAAAFEMGENIDNIIGSWAKVKQSVSDWDGSI